MPEPWLVVVGLLALTVGGAIWADEPMRRRAARYVRRRFGPD